MNNHTSWRVASSALLLRAQWKGPRGSEAQSPQPALARAGVFSDCVGAQAPGRVGAVSAAAFPQGQRTSAPPPWVTLCPLAYTRSHASLRPLSTLCCPRYGLNVCPRKRHGEVSPSVQRCWEGGLREVIREPGGLASLGNPCALGSCMALTDLLGSCAVCSLANGCSSAFLR